MAYTHSKYEVFVAEDASLASAADIGDWAPGYVPHRIRAAALVLTTSPDAAGQVKVDKRPTAGSDTSRGDGDVAQLDYTTDEDAGEVVYIDGIDVTVNPGEELVFEVSDATPTAGAAHLVLYVEPMWETPANNSNMVEG